MNLLTETLAILKDYKKEEKDILFVSNKGWCTWEKFKSMADIEYYNDDECGSKIPDIVVVGDNWWLERRASDLAGTEWWEFNTKPVKPKTEDTNNNIFTL